MSTTKIDTTLWALARCPFLTAEDLALLGDGLARAARAHLLRQYRAGLVDYIPIPRTHLRLYYLTEAGLAAAADAAETEPEVLAARFGLGERALLRRLPGLERLLASRRILFALHRALVARDGTLENWRAWPVPWRYTLDTRGTQPRVLHLDGEGTIRWTRDHGSGRAFGLLWDGDGNAPAAVLTERLMQVEGIYHAHVSAGPRAPRVPPVLLVTVAPDRVPAGYRPWLLWSTCAEIAQRGILDAPWRGSSTRGQVLPLADALATLGTMSVLTPLGAPLSRAEERPAQGRRDDRMRLRQRVRMLRHGAQVGERLSLLALVIPPRGLRMLEVIGQHPLLSAADIAIASGLGRVDTWGLLALLRRHALIDVWMPRRNRRIRCTRRHLLTARGLRLLSLHTGLAPGAYRRIYGALDEADTGQRRGIAFAQANLAHTDGINRVYLALLAVARASGSRVQWRGEWACTHAYEDGPHLRTLRPDAEGTYTDSGVTLHFYLEVDRGTMRVWRLAAKLARYYAYRCSAGCGQITLLLVTSGHERATTSLRLNAMLAARRGTAPLDLRVTTYAELAEHGASGRIWRGGGGLRDTLRLRAQGTAGASNAVAEQRRK